MYCWVSKHAYSVFVYVRVYIHTFKVVYHGHMHANVYGYTYECCVSCYVHVLYAHAGLFEVKADGVGSLRDRLRPWRIDTLWHLSQSAWLVTSLKQPILKHLCGRQSDTCWLNRADWDEYKISKHMMLKHFLPSECPIAPPSSKYHVFGCGADMFECVWAHVCFQSIGSAACRNYKKC